MLGDGKYGKWKELPVRLSRALLHFYGFGNVFERCIRLIA